MVAETSELKTVVYRDQPILFKAQEKKKRKKESGKGNVKDKQPLHSVRDDGVGEAAGKRPRNFCCTEPRSVWGLGADTCEKWKTF